MFEIVPNLKTKKTYDEFRYYYYYVRDFISQEDDIKRIIFLPDNYKVLFNLSSEYYEILNTKTCLVEYMSEDLVDLLSMFREDKPTFKVFFNTEERSE